MRKHILLVDQSRTIQVLLVTYFRNTGHAVIVCSTPQEALHVLAGLHPVPDSIFLAVGQSKEAYKVINHVKEHEAYSSTRLIAMVAEEEKAALERTLYGVIYLVKPFHIQDALALVSTPEGASSRTHM